MEAQEGRPLPRRYSGLKPGHESGIMTIVLPIGTLNRQVDTDVAMTAPVVFDLAMSIFDMLADCDVLDKELLHTELHDLGIIK
jgi:hypothetical protein